MIEGIDIVLNAVTEASAFGLVVMLIALGLKTVLDRARQ